jgi:hypothetical protein
MFHVERWRRAVGSRRAHASASHEPGVASDLRARQEAVACRRTELNVSLTGESTNASEGGFALGAKNLYEPSASAPGDEITLKTADNHWAEIKSGRSATDIQRVPR